MLAQDNIEVVWAPQPGPQSAFIKCPHFEVFFGGARGGGKTDAVLGDWVTHTAKHGPDAIGLMVRRTRTELLETFERARTIYSKLGATATINPMRFNMPNGGRITYAYLERDSDAETYQGASFTRVYVEEAGNFPSPAPILKLMATLRSGAGVPVGLRLTGNPGGPGHQWVRSRYIDPAPLGWRKIIDSNTGLDRIYIPSRVSDNHYLGPDYVQRLKASGSPELVRAWLEGDWSVVSGAFFPEFSLDRHVISPKPIPEHWARFRSFDWGSARPFCCHWWAVSDGSDPAVARGALVLYREWYGMRPGEPNVGLKMTAEAVAAGIREREADDPQPMLGVADPAIFAEDGGPSIAQRMTSQGVMFRAADNKRVPARGAMGGWDQLRARLVGDDDGKPMVLMFSTARDLIRTLPAMQHDDARPEDIDSDAEDHAADCCFVASTRITTARGQVPINQMRVGDMVATRAGMQPVTAVFSVGEREVFDVRLSDGRTLTGTANHPVWIEGKGFVSLSSLRYGDMMRPCASSSSAIRSKSSTASDTISAEATTSTAGNGCIGWSGRRAMALFQGARTSITRITTSTTTSLTTWSALVARTTLPIMAGFGLARLPSAWPFMPGQVPLSGTGPMPGWSGIGSTGKPTAEKQCSAASSMFANSAARPSTDWTSPARGSAPTLANRHGDGHRASITSNASAPAARNHSPSTNTPSSVSARGHAPTQALTSERWWNIAASIVAARFKPLMHARSGAPIVAGEPTPAGRRKVYNLSVAQAEEYFANGVLVHNCRYAMMSRPWIKEAAKPVVRDSWDAAFQRADDAPAEGWRVA